MKNRPAVLLFNIIPERRSQILPLCQKFGIRARGVAPEEYGQEIGALAGLEGHELSGEKFEGEHFRDEMMVMCGFSRKLLEDFLDSFRRSNVRSVALKAVITEHNLCWDCICLHEEIKKEHEMMRAGAGYQADS